MPADALGDIDAVLVSHHHHGDNLDPTARGLLPGWGTTVTTVKGAQHLGGGAVGLLPWGTTTLEAPDKPAVTITATPCRHGPPGMDPITGPVIGFSLTWDGQQNGALWVTGDTVLYPGLREVPQRIGIGSIVLHLGAVRFAYLTGPFRYTHGRARVGRAARAGRSCGRGAVHYEGWSHFKQGREAAEPVLATSPFADRVHWLDPGETTEFEA